VLFIITVNIRKDFGRTKLKYGRKSVVWRSGFIVLFLKKIEYCTKIVFNNYLNLLSHPKKLTAQIGMYSKSLHFDEEHYPVKKRVFNFCPFNL